MGGKEGSFLYLSIKESTFRSSVMDIIAVVNEKENKLFQRGREKDLNQKENLKKKNLSFDGFLFFLLFLWFLHFLHAPFVFVFSTLPKQLLPTKEKKINKLKIIVLFNNHNK